MRSIITTLALTISLTLTAGLAGCGSDDGGGASCTKVTEHFLEVMPDELKGKLGDKKSMVARCEKELNADDRKCAMAAKDMDGIMACSAKAKQRKG